MDLGFDIWRSVVTSYQAPTTPPTNTTRNKLNENNVKSMNAILHGLSKSKFVKVMHCP